MRLILRHGVGWEIGGMKGFRLNEYDHFTAFRPEKGAVRLSFSAERPQVEDHPFIHMGIYLQGRKVHVTFLEEEV